MFLDCHIKLEILPDAQSCIATIESCITNIDGLFSFTSRNGLPARPCQLFLSEIALAHKAVLKFIADMEKLREACQRDKFFKRQIFFLFGHGHLASRCKQEAWDRSIQSLATSSNGSVILRSSITGARHAQELALYLELMVRDYDPNELDWDISAITTRTHWLKERFSFIQELFDALPPVQ